MHVLRYGAESRKPKQCVKIGNACIKIGMNVLRHAKAFGNVYAYGIVRLNVLRYGIGHFRHCAIFFGTVRFFSKKTKNFWVPAARA